MPPNTVKVDRSTPFGNPWYVGPGRVKLAPGCVCQIGPEITARGAVDRFRRWLLGEFENQRGDMIRHPIYGCVPSPRIKPDVTALRGKDLACWCKPGAPCHADVLLELANAPPQ